MCVSRKRCGEMRSRLAACVRYCFLPSERKQIMSFGAGGDEIVGNCYSLGKSVAAALLAALLAALSLPQEAFLVA